MNDANSSRSTIGNAIASVLLCLSCVLIVPSVSGTMVYAEAPLGRFVRTRPIAGLNSPWQDQTPFVLADGLTIYFTSGRPYSDEVPASDDFNVYVSTRKSIDDPFDTPLLVADPISTLDVHDSSLSLSADNTTLYFGSSRDGGAGRGDIWLSSRTTVVDAWAEPVNLGTSVNTSQREFGPSISADGLSLYFTRGASGSRSSEDIYVATRSAITEAFGDAEVVAISEPNVMEAVPSISSDGLALFYQRGSSTVFELWVATRDSVDAEFANPVNVRQFSLGGALSGSFVFTPQISADWPSAGSKLYYGSTNGAEDWDLYESTWVLNGDLNANTEFDADDLDRLTAEIQRTRPRDYFDLNRDSAVDEADRRVWVESMANTYFGDSNLDGEFNSSDFVHLLEAGQYEDAIVGTSTWATGDWNGDGEFDSRDFVAAFQSGGYEKGPRPASAAIPEPSSVLLLVLGIAITFRRRAGGNVESP